MGKPKFYTIKLCCSNPIAPIGKPITYQLSHIGITVYQRYTVNVRTPEHSWVEPSTPIYSWLNSNRNLNLRTELSRENINRKTFSKPQNRN